MNDIVKTYMQWMESQFACIEKGGFVEITTPFLDRHNDKIQIYAQRKNGNYLLTDAGEVLSDLQCCGMDFNTDKRRALLMQTLNGFGVKEVEGELRVQASESNLGQKTNNLIQAMLSVNDLFCLARSSVSSLFLEDVENWLNKKEIRFLPAVNMVGKSGLSYRFDFAIPKSQTKGIPERLLRVMNYPDKGLTQQILLSWVDTKEARPEESRLFVLVNDSEQKIPAATLEAFSNYELRTIPWSQKEDFVEELAA